MRMIEDDGEDDGQDDNDNSEDQIVMRMTLWKVCNKKIGAFFWP